MMTVMADIDFSGLPTESSITMGSWFRAFGVVRAIVILVLLLAFGVLANIYTTPTIQYTAIVLEIIVILVGGYMAVGFNKNRELKAIQQFASANNFSYQPMAEMARTELPPSISSQYTAKTVKIYYRLAGKIGNHDFELFHVRGLYYAVWNRAYIDLTVLEVKGVKKAASSGKNIKTEAMGSGVRVIKSGNALSAEDMEGVFTAAGLS